ncbi:type I glyceraldehyde-3-phosphate dehydrogenase [Gammaproteobacteria bacterium]|nr:type I glyceraldehyde-3-phosphate dehydrogenase [Gammaproteobacteria bacterium]MDA9039401.1 type I glyceraldehyde-3-phosphate dehydrogenase [Gammaproteobacteria bacterium]
MKVAINGFGRIGKNLTRQLIEADCLESGDGNLELVAVNDLGNVDANAHLLKYDSIHGKISNAISTIDSKIVVDGKSINYISERDPNNLPWEELGIDVVFECTGLFTSKEAASAHINAGAKRVIVSAPCSDADKTIVFGINHNKLGLNDKIISNASCTTNCLAPLADVIHKNFTIKSGLINTVHAATNDQSLLDVAHSDLYRARAASASIIPSKTGAAKAIGLVIPELEGKLNGMATRVPVLNVSLLDLTFETEKDFTEEELCQVLRDESDTRLKGILSYNEIPLVSSDFMNETASCVFDANHITKIGNQTKILAWYDNEWGFSNRLIDLAIHISKMAQSELQKSA